MVPLPVISPHYALRSLSSVASIPHAARLSYHWTACAVNWLNLRRTGGSTCSGQVAQATPDRRLRRTGIFIYVTDLGVDRNYTRQGIGRRLMKTAHQMAGGEKDIAVYLIANENAVPFYEKCGMKKADDVMQYNHIEWTGFTVT